MHKPAKEPHDLERFFVERANARDIDGLVMLYDADAVLVSGDGEVVRGLDEIRAFFIKYLAGSPKLKPSKQTQALCSGNLALTSSQIDNGDTTAEIARRQPDGNWLWVVDQFSLRKRKK